MKKTLTFICLFFICTLSFGEENKSNDWGEADIKWAKFAKEHMDRMREHDLTLPLAKLPNYKFDMEWGRLKNPFLHKYFPEYRFYGDKRFTFALNKEGHIICLHSFIPLKTPFKTTPDLKVKEPIEFLKESRIKILNKEIAREVVIILNIIKNAGNKGLRFLEETKGYRVEKRENGWFVDTPDGHAGNSTYENVNYVVITDADGLIEEIKKEVFGSILDFQEISNKGMHRWEEYKIGESQDSNK